MYKLCLVLGFLAIAAAKPSWPLSYPTYPAIPSAAYPAYGSAAFYSATPGFSSYSVVPNAVSAPVAASFPTSFATAYSYKGVPAVVKPVVASAPISTAAIAAVPGYDGYPSPYAAAVAPFGVAPFSPYAYGTPFAWKKK